MRNVAKKGLLTAVATGSVLASTAGYAYASAEAHGGAVNSPGVGSGNTVQVPVDVPINACGNTVDVIGLLNPSYGNRCANVDAGAQGPGAPAASTRPNAGGTGSEHPAHGQQAPDHAGGGQAGNDHTGPDRTGSDLPGAGQWRPGGGAGGPARGSDTFVPGASASGTAVGSPGVLSGNQAQAPVDVPVNACGNSVNVVGIANPAFGNSCANVEAPPAPQEDCPPEETPQPPKETPGTPRAGGPADSPVVTPVVAPAAAVPTQAPQLASTGAGGVEMLGAAGLAALLGGGVLYRRSRAGVR